MRQALKSLKLIAAAALVSCAAGVQATTLTLSNWVPPTHFITTDILQVWAKDVEQATEGRVKIRMLPKPVGSPPQHWELARKGIADITWGNFTYEPDRFKAIWFAEFPFSGDNAEAQSVALWDTYQKYLKDTPTFQGVKLLGTGMFGGGAIHHGSKNIVTPEDLANQKIRMGGPIQKRLLEEMGAVPIAAPAPQVYELVENGVVDGSLNPIESVINFRAADMLKHHTLVPGGFYDATFFLAMNEGTWNKLSEADKKAIMSVSGEHFSRLWGSEYDRQTEMALKELKEQNHQFNTPSPELMANIEEVNKTVVAEWAADSASFNIDDPMEMVEFYRSRYNELKNKN